MSKKEVQRGGGRVFTPLKGMFLFLALILMLAGSLNASGCGQTPSSLFSLTLHCQQIFIDNQQGTAYQANSQIAIQVPFNTLSNEGYLANNGMNLYFYVGNTATVAPAWLYGNTANVDNGANLYEDANVLYYVLVPYAIPAGFTDGNIVLGIGSTSTDFFTNPNANVGVQPDLWGTGGNYPVAAYGQSDNGRHVFKAYENFTGTTIDVANVIITNDVGGTSATMSESQNNGLQVGVSAIGSGAAFSISWNSIVASPITWMVKEIIQNAGANTNFQDGLVIDSATTTSLTVGTSGQNQYISRVCNAACPAGLQLWYATSSSNGQIGSTAGGAPTYPYNTISSMTQLSASSVNVIEQNNVVSTSSSPVSFTSGYPGINSYESSSGSAGNMEFIQWMLALTPPPDDTNATISYGAISVPTTSTLTITPNPATYGQSILITGECANPTDSCAVDYPTLGTHLCTGTGSCTYTYPAWQLAAGTYSSFYTNDITAGTNSTPLTLTINKNGTVITWTAQCQNPTMQIFSNPNPCTTTGYAPSNANQLVANLYLNNLLESSTSSTSNTATYSLTTNNIGNYGFVFNTLGNGNYIANSISYNTLIYAQVNVKNVSANGNVISFAANVQANPYTWNTYFPYGFFTSSPSNTLNFTLSQLFDSALSNPTRTALQTNVLNLSYIPQSSQPTGNYLYNITERQIGNAQTVRFSINAVSANMIDFNGQLNFIGQCDKYIQYFPNCAVFPYESNVFTVKPLSWSIKSDMLVLQHSNFTGAVANTEQWSNANITFTPTYSMSYPSPFGSYTVNLIDNPSLQQTLTQTAFKFYTQNTVPASPYTRKITNVSTYDQQLFTPLYTNDTNLISLLMNNYTIPQNSSKVVNSIAYNTYIALSDYQNPAIYFYNSTILSSTKNHYSTVNNYCPITLTNGNFATYKPYLANLNASLYTFDIYQGSGYGATNYTMVVETGASPSSAIEVQSYKINQVPFALPLQNGQEYRFLFYNKNCTLVYTSPFSIWPQTITLYLPSNQSLGQFSYSLANAYCNTYHNSKIEYVICNGQDPTGLTSSWDVNITQPSVLSIIPVANYSFASSSFMLNWTVPNSMKLYTVNIYYNNAKTPLDPLVVSYPVNPKSSLTTVESYGLMSLFFFLVMVIAAFSDIRAAIVMGLLSIFIGGIAQLNLLTLTSFAVLTIIGGTVVFLLRNKFGE